MGAPRGRLDIKPGRAGNRPTRALAIYLFAVALPTLALLALGLEAVRRQADAIRKLSATNLRLQEAQVVDAAEVEALAAAEACLHDQTLTRILLDTDWDDPRLARRGVAALEEVRTRHPIFDEAFVVEADTVRFPRLIEPLPLSADVLLAAEPQAARHRLQALFETAETLEFRGAWAAAMRQYAALEERAETAPVRALALARQARIRERTGAIDQAFSAHARLLDTFGDEHDPGGRPYALVAGIEMARLSSSRASEPPPQVRDALLQLAGDLGAGRWELTAAQARYYGRELERALGRPLVHADAPLFQRIALAERLRAEFRPQETRGGAGSTVIDAGAGARQLFYRPAERPGRGQAFIGVVAADGFLSAHVASVARALGVAAETRVVPAADGTPFRRLFTFASVSLSNGAPTPGAWARDTLLFGATTLAVLGLLVFGLVLVTRDIARDATITRLRSNLVSGVSHELKTPLSVIRLYAETLAADPAAPAPERHSYYDIILEESDRLTLLIDRVLEFSRIEKEGREYQLVPTDMRQLAAAVASRYRSYVESSGLAFDVVLDAAPRVLADSDAVTRALVNLLDNATKYSQPATRVTLRVTTRRESVIVEVQDEGIGIPVEQRGRILQPFVRASGTGGGYGLGLYLVNHVVNGHHGSLEIESEPNRGSTFRLVLPVAPEQI